MKRFTFRSENPLFLQKIFFLIYFYMKNYRKLIKSNIILNIQFFIRKFELKILSDFFFK